MQEQVVQIEVAQADIERWLDGTMVMNSKRVASKSDIELMTDAICDGLLVVNEDLTLSQKLLYPLEGVSHLTYKSRLSVGDPASRLKEFKADDVHGMVLAYVATLTQKPNALIKNIDRKDYRISTAIAGFFF
jgi:hypothetical protein